MAARRLLAAGAVFLNGRRCRVASRTVQPATRYRCRATRRPQRHPADHPYEDDTVIAVDKPAGMPSAPTRQRRPEARRHPAHPAAHPRRAACGPVGRPPTRRRDSGVLVFARTRRPLRRCRRPSPRSRWRRRISHAWRDRRGRHRHIDLPLRSEGRRTWWHPTEVRTYRVAGRRARPRHHAAHRPARTGRLPPNTRTPQRHPPPGCRRSRYGGRRAALMLHAARVRLHIRRAA